MEDSKEMAKVTLGIFSGLPNPEMILTEENIIKYAEMVKSTVGKEDVYGPTPTKLGEFYGFMVIVSDDKAKELGIPKLANIIKGVFADMTIHNEPKYWRDLSRIEQFLIGLAYENGFADLLKKVGVKRSE